MTGAARVPGGCPATPPPAGACPRRAWWRGAGQEDRRAGGAAAEGAPGCSDEADAPCPPRPRARPRLATGRRPRSLPPTRRPSSQPSPPRSRINRKCGERAGELPEVWRPRFRRTVPRGKPQHVERARLLSARGGWCQGLRLGSRLLKSWSVHIKAPNAKLESATIRFIYLRLPRKLLNRRKSKRTDFCRGDPRHFFFTGGKKPTHATPLFLDKSHCPLSSSERRFP